MRITFKRPCFRILVIICLIVEDFTGLSEIHLSSSLVFFFFFSVRNAAYVSAHMRMEWSSIRFLATIISIQHVL